MKLVLGVLEVAYSDAGGGATTTGDVATILEQNYGVMETFFELNKEKIAQMLADSVAASIQDLVNGGPRTSPTFGAEQQIEQLFRTFIYSNTMQRIFGSVGGVISQAAQNGVSSRRKSPRAKRAPRPAFVDTGLYVQSFRAWVSSDVGAAV